VERLHVTLTAHARRDLNDVWSFLCKEAGSVIADAVVARIVETMYRAAENPFAYRRRKEFLGSPRRINVFRYAILFDLTPPSKSIIVWRVIHGARDAEQVDSERDDVQNDDQSGEVAA
jgi:plasmid stabilization system protein ParE